MHTKLSGRVMYRNHLPAKGVEVRVFDRDDPGKIDDDLTVKPGWTDESGAFSVSYDPALFRDMITTGGTTVADPGDQYIPYARFAYTINGEQRYATSPVLMYRRDYLLPESHPLQIDPLVHSFEFPNSFAGYALPFRMPNLPGVKEVGSIHGLCGGVSAAIYDFYLSGRSVPTGNAVPEKGTPLYKYLYKRQRQSYGTVGETVMKFAEWMLMPDNGPNSIRQRTFQALESIKAELQEGNAVLLGLVYVDWRNGFQIWNNHQVLAYRFTVEGPCTDLYLCDPNYPRNASVKIVSEQLPGNPPGVVSSQWVNGQKVKDVRGYFPIPYTPVIPPRTL